MMIVGVSCKDVKYASIFINSENTSENEQNSQK